MRISKDVITSNGAMKIMWMKGMQLLEDRAKRLVIWRKPDLKVHYKKMPH